MKNKHYKRGHRAGIVWALLIIVVGALFAGVNMGFIPYNISKVILSWQMLVMIIGLTSLLHRHTFSGILMIIFSGFFMIPRLSLVFPDAFNWVGADFVSVYWPFLLIAGGVLLLLHILFKPKNPHCDFHKHGHKKRTYKNTGSFEKNSVFGNGEHIILDPEFNGGEINAVFGGITLDLRKTTLPEGETVLEVNAVFGGVEIFVPQHWVVEIHLDTIFGGFNDERIISDEVDHSRKLVIHGGCIFGGGELKN